MIGNILEAAILALMLLVLFASAARMNIRELLALIGTDPASAVLRKEQGLE